MADLLLVEVVEAEQAAGADAGGDTSGATQAGSRWQHDMRSGSGYVVRHPVGL